jgi:ribosome-binding ATPase YchF (GTP1/OBG family)
MEIGILGKPNVGKSTFFAALTLIDVPIAPYPFTTIDPNRGVAAVRAPCPHRPSNPCTPGNARCQDGTRWVPVNLIDVPGLVPGAHEGRGLGHKFLDDLRAADGLIQIVDLSGSAADDGTLAGPGTTDPAREVTWLAEELVEWVTEILGRNFDREARSVELEGRKLEEFLQRRLTGLSISPAAIATARRALSIDLDHPSRWSAEDRRRLARELLYAAKPRTIAANKCDRSTPAELDRLRGAVDPLPVQAMCAEAELSLRKAARAGLVRYLPGDRTFELLAGEHLSAAQRRALEEIHAIVDTWGGTGVQSALESTVFGQLHQMVVYPVEDENRWTDSKGRVLPDALLVPEGTTARGLAYRVHTELGDQFIRAIDGRTHRALAADHPLEPNSVVRVVARK